jgi:hypothetical protein
MRLSKNFSLPDKGALLNRILTFLTEPCQTKVKSLCDTLEKGDLMNLIANVLYVIFSPVLVVIYWKNSIKSLDDLHGEILLEQN